VSLSQNCSVLVCTLGKFFSCSNGLWRLCGHLSPPQIHVLLVMVSQAISIVDALFHTLMLLWLYSRTVWEITHFFFELAHITRLSSSDILTDDSLISVSGGVLGGILFPGIIFSYINIIYSVLKMPASEGKFKTFSTSGFHVSVISLFYGTSLGV
jgi:olfactory receptor